MSYIDVSLSYLDYKAFKWSACASTDIPFRRKTAKSIWIQIHRKLTSAIFFQGFSKASLGNMIGSYMTSFIKVTRLESCQKSGELWFEEE